MTIHRSYTLHRRCFNLYLWLSIKYSLISAFNHDCLLTDSVRELYWHSIGHVDLSIKNYDFNTGLCAARNDYLVSLFITRLKNLDGSEGELLKLFLPGSRSYLQLLSSCYLLWEYPDSWFHSRGELFAVHLLQASAVKLALLVVVRPMVLPGVLLLNCFCHRLVSKVIDIKCVNGGGRNRRIIF